MAASPSSSAPPPHPLDMIQESTTLDELLAILREGFTPQSVEKYGAQRCADFLPSIAAGNLLLLPFPDTAGTWNEVSQKIQFVDATADALRNSFEAFPFLYVKKQDTLPIFFRQLLAILVTLERWLLKDDVEVQPGLPSPAALKHKLWLLVSDIFRQSILEIHLRDDQDTTYDSYDGFIGSIIEFSENLGPVAPPLPYPLTITWFCQGPVQKDPRKFYLQSAVDIPQLIGPTIEHLLLLLFEAAPHHYILETHRSSLLGSLKCFFDFCLTSSCFPDPNLRCHYFLQAFKLCRQLIPLSNDAPTVLTLHNYIGTRLFEGRMDGDIYSDVYNLDETLEEYLKSSLKIVPTRSLIIQAIQTLILPDFAQQDNGPGATSLATQYLKRCTSDADDDTLLFIQNELAKSSSAEAAALLVDLQKPAKKSSATQPSATQPIPGRLNMKDHIWRREMKTLVSNIISPDPVSWMDDESRPNESPFMRTVLNDVSDRFSRPLERIDPESRIKLAQDIAKLPCLLTLCSGENCLLFRKVDGFHMAHLYVPVLVSLLRGERDEVTYAVKRHVYKAMRSILGHRTEEDPGLDIMGIIFQGLGDMDRSIRLQAGIALGAVLEVYALNISPSPGDDEVLQQLFHRIFRHIENHPGPVKETMIVSLGKIGKIPQDRILCRVICVLFAQLGRPTRGPALKGVVSNQIISMAHHHKKKTPYALILPYLEKVATLIVDHMCTQPEIVEDACQLMQVSSNNFLSITLPKTLPPVLVRCDAKTLDMLARHLDKEQHALFVGEGMHLHLAPIFLLKTPEETNKSIDFILGILNQATSIVIDLRQVLPGCTTPLLTEIIVEMGDINPNKAGLARSAIQKVETALKTGHCSQLHQASDPGAFLSAQMLGIMSRIIDMLQDVHGKKSVLAKQKIIRSLGELVLLIGPSIHGVGSQIMATFQTMISVPELSAVTVESWNKFVTILRPVDLGPYLGATCAAFVSAWPTLPDDSREIVYQTLHFTFSNNIPALRQHLNEIVDLSVVDRLAPIQLKINRARSQTKPEDILYPLLARCSSNNVNVATLSLAELRRFMQSEHRSYLQSSASGDVFEPIIGRVLSVLYKAACRDGDGTENLRLIAYECIGVLGAVDPYRFEMEHSETDMVLMKNFTEEGETMAFVLHLIQDLLVDAFRSTSDIKYQTNLAYPIQELLKHCGFSSDLVNSGRSAPLKIRNRWNTLSKDVLDVVTPLLEGRFAFNHTSTLKIVVPVYPTQSTYREWLQLWVTHLISKASGSDAKKIFSVFLSVVRSKDVVVAKHLLPHLVLNVLLSGKPEDSDEIRAEINAVLKDQADPESTSTTDKKLLSAQAIFALLDHLNRWARFMRRDMGEKKSGSKRARAGHIIHEGEEQLVRLDSILSNIDQNMMANAAFQCKAYARSLMSFEQQILTLQQTKGADLQEYYDKVHEIYSHLDEPDGMEGISPLILSPSLEHQIREHESTGKWTAAQSCWEVSLQHSPDNLDFHLGLLRCLRNLGHYDTLRNHVKGVLTNHPEWEPSLADFQVESAWMVGAWGDISSLVERVDVQTPGVVLAKVLLAMRRNDSEAVSSSLAVARKVLGTPITASGVDGYRRTYTSVLSLHMTHELEMTYNIAKELPGTSGSRRKALTGLSSVLALRLESTLPTFRCREPILSMRRAGFTLMPSSHSDVVNEVGSSWLASAKIARKAGHWQAAYSAMLQARQHDANLYFVESAKLLKAAGEPLKALQELESHMRSAGLTADSTVVDLTVSEEETAKVKGKLHLLRARWMNESERYDATAILTAFQVANELDKSLESSHFYFGSFYDTCFKELKPSELKRGIKMNIYTVRHYAKAIKLGSKYIYHTVPRLLTLWLDNGEKAAPGDDWFPKMNLAVKSAIKEIPAYKWFTAFPQIVSRVVHSSTEVFEILGSLIVSIMQEYPGQALWLFSSALRSTNPVRKKHGMAIMDMLKSTPSGNKKLHTLIKDMLNLTAGLLALCDRWMDPNRTVLSISRDYPELKSLGSSPLLIPLQDSLTANLPSSSSAEGVHQPFPPDPPTFSHFAEEVEVMKSLAKPRKITIYGHDGQVYMFLGKPKDDLRKDARLMDFNSIINKLLKANSDARRRQLHIRTYGVVTLNEECGFIQWVPNTIPIRPVLVKIYDAKQIKTWNNEISQIFQRIKLEKSDAKAEEIFKNEVMAFIPPVFHEWFIETFPEPSAWLASRLSYGRTAAVMSMVGYILGLGDRHCENILLDVNSGDMVHVDFNCLFERGKLLETPERVPFRLTQNIVDGLGITGVEGVFRVACELTMDILRQNKDSLMSVLDAFIHDPLVEWEEEKRKQDRTNRNRLKLSTASIAKNSLEPIEKKLEGYYDVTKAKHETTRKLLSTNNLVESLIQDATNQAYLAKMYPGWAPWH